MNKLLIYDLPTRIFHWLFSILFVVAFFIAKTVDDDSPTFSYHMLAGILLSGLVLLRIIWGLVGSKYARFSSFALSPMELLGYIKGIFSGSKYRWAGHNPGSSWAAMIMFGCALMLGLTGFLMSTGSKETYEDAHELFANAFLVMVLLHIAGLLLHSFRHRDAIGLSMITGTKELNDADVSSVSSRPVVAILFIIIMASFGGHIFRQYDSTKGELTIFGKTLFLSENENEDENHNKTSDNESKDENEEDDDD